MAVQLTIRSSPASRQPFFMQFDRYVIKEILPPFGLGLLVYTFVLLMNQILLLSQMFIDRGVAFKTVLALLFYLIPSVLAFTIPMSVLMGILAGLSRMSSDAEITAFKTLGINYGRLLRPVLFFSFCGWLVTSFLTLYGAPRANYRWVQILTRSVLSKVQFVITPREFNESIPRTVLYIQDIAPDKSWENIFVHFTGEGRAPAVILAEKARMNVFGEEKRAVLELFRGTVHTYQSQTPEDYTVTAFEHREMELDVGGFFASVSNVKRVREKDIRELWVDAALLKREARTAEAAEPNSFRMWPRERNLAAHWIEIHKKFALPFACFIFALLGIALGATTRKGGRTSGFTISIVIILIYYILITAGENLAMDGRLSPWLGMWGPNILLTLCGLAIFLSAHKEWTSLLPFRKSRRPPPEARTGRIRRRPLRLPKPALPFPGILDRYIIRKYLGIFLLGFVSMLAVFVIITFFDRIDSIYEHNKPLALFFSYLWYKIPEFVHLILPMSALIATLLSLGLLTKFNEITAMKACGVSLYRTVLPVLMLAVVVSFVSFYLQENILPSTNRKAEEVWNVVEDRPPRYISRVDRRWVIGRQRDRIFHYRQIDTIASVFHQITIFDIDPRTWTLGRRVFAEKASLLEGELMLSNTWRRDFEGGLPVSFDQQDRMILPVSEDMSYFLKESKEPSQMDFNELSAYIQRSEEQGFETMRFKVDLHSKLAFPLVSLIMVLVGIPFAFSMGKRGALVGIGLAMIIVVVYWVALSVFRSMGYAGLLNPLLAAWGPNLIFGLMGAYLIFTVRT